MLKDTNLKQSMHEVLLVERRRRLSVLVYYHYTIPLALEVNCPLLFLFQYFVAYRHPLHPVILSLTTKALFGLL